ncbi:hypothetical protein QBC32DRAFT_370096 [Pseudoneurospora amorphoporcata]|uniref:Zn(2)-C6 fungal-type domain-containing protein n=1 Tax=Pseudoneurospora amorphoporcata TaxID=241081 RepID=A0AAN6NYY9_9PEZI|nr:hypothetical protein QBC32DRAFT_370096 [Pseudoneurospora amorphoporcata]
MQNFREIRPASIPTNSHAGHHVEGTALQPRGVDHHAEQQPHNVSPGFAAVQQGPQRIESIVLPRRKRSVVQACRDCRKTKAKCGGQRPKCNNCKAKGRPCGYDGEEGQSRYMAMKSRLALLEKTMQQLRKAATPDQALHLIEDLQRAPDEFFTPMAAVDEDENMSTTGTPLTMVTTPATGTPVPSLQHASSCNSLNSSSNGQKNNQTCTASSSSRHNSGQGQEQEEWASPFHVRDRASVSTEPPILSPTPWQLGDNNATKSPAAIHLPIPDLETTNLAIKEYFIRIDRLFQPFSRKELQVLHRIASSGFDGKRQQQQIALSCLCAVASLGSQCRMDDAQTDDTRVQEHREAFTNIARHYLDVVMEHEPLDAVRVCALLAGTVIMDKPGLALSYVETGMNLFSRAYRMNDGAAAAQKQAAAQHHQQVSLALALNPPTPAAHKETIGHGRSWRTLVFLASWLSSAHGYIIGSDLLVERQLSPEAEPPYPDNADLVEITEIALTRLCYIKSFILRLRASNRDLTPHSIRHVLNSLRDWYRTLPPSIQLNLHNLSHFSPSSSSGSPCSFPGPSGTTSSLLETHRSIHHLHILYSDSITLLYRWLISQSITCRLHGNHEGHHALDTPLRELLLQHADDAIRVAGLSAVVLRRMIHNDQEILMPCWTAGFQAYTSCAVLLWSVVGKMLNGVGVGSCLHPDPDPCSTSDMDHAVAVHVKKGLCCSSWESELERVRDCLVVLELCARLGGGSGRDGAERWWRRMRALLSVVERSATYRAWEQQQQQQQQQREQQQQHPRPPPAFDPVPGPQDRSYLLTLPSQTPHATANSGKPIDYSLARVSVSLIMLLHQSFGAPGSHKLEGVGDDEFAFGDWSQDSPRGSTAGGEDGSGDGAGGFLLDMESEQARILEWLGWKLACHR